MRKVYGLMQNAACIILVFCILAPVAHAYLDPGSGSMMLQLLLAGLAGVVVAIKVFWRRILVFFGLAKDKNRDAGKSSP
jgi:hypothetical protein